MSGPGSGIAVNEECIKKFNELKQKEKSARCIIYKITDDNKQVVIEEERPKSDCWKTDMQTIFDKLKEQEGDPRYLILDVPMDAATEGAAASDRVVLMSWIPDNAPVKKKMMYASTMATIKSAFKGFYKFIAATDISDIEVDAFAKNLRKK